MSRRRRGASSRRISNVLGRSVLPIGVLAVLALLVSTCGEDVQPNDDSLKVGLFPWVPRFKQFEDGLRSAWQQRHSDVTLFVTDQGAWDGGYTKEPSGLDIFVFDAIFLSDYQREGYLAAFTRSEVVNISDFADYTVKGSTIDGTMFGLPVFGNADLLFYRKNDTELSKAVGLGDVLSALGACTFDSLIPDNQAVGLMVDLSHLVSNACRYLHALEANYGVYTADPPLAPSNDTIDPWAGANLRTILSMASVANGVYYNTTEPYHRSEWFGQGHGRALLDRTQALTAMGSDLLSTINFKLMPFSDRPDVPLVYLYLAGVSPCLQGNKRALAIELANLMSSTEVLLNSTGPTSISNASQYVLPARWSMFDRLTDDRLYRRMFELVKGAPPNVLRLGVAASDWLNERKHAILNKIFNPTPCPSSIEPTTEAQRSSQTAPNPRLQKPPLRPLEQPRGPNDRTESRLQRKINIVVPEIKTSQEN